MAEAILVNPNTLGSYRFEGKPREALALGALGAALDGAGFDVELIDGRVDGLTQEEMTAEILRHNPRLIGFTFMGQEPAIWAAPVIAKIKQELPDTHITAGSYFPTLDPIRCSEWVSDLDSLAIGEGENLLIQLAGKVIASADWESTPGLAFKRDGTLHINPRMPLIEDLDTLPFRFVTPSLGK